MSCCAVAGAGYGLLLGDVVLRGPLGGVDSAARSAARSHQVAALRAVLDALTVVLSPPVSMLLLLLATGFAMLSRPRFALLASGTALAGLAVLVLGAKSLVIRASPDGSARTAGWFPSGHTSALLVCLGTVAILTTSPGTVARRRALGAVYGAGAVVAGSLLYGSYHWLTDVVAAGAVSGVVLPLVLLVEGRVSEHRM